MPVALRRKNLVSNVEGAAINLDLKLNNPRGIVSLDKYIFVVNNNSNFLEVYDNEGRLLLSQDMETTGWTAITYTYYIDASPNGIIYYFKILGHINDSDIEYDLKILINISITIIDHLGPYSYSKINYNYKDTYFNLNFGRYISFGNGTLDYPGIILPSGLYINPIKDKTYAPFGGGIFGNRLIVLYAKRNPTDPLNALSGPGNGYIVEYRITGGKGKILYQNGVLNSPHAIILAPQFLCFPCGYFLIGNCGDGKINVFDEKCNYISTLKDCNENNIIIDNLWTLCVIAKPAYANSIFFTAGTSGGTGGYVGRLDKDDCCCKY